MNLPFSDTKKLWQKPVIVIAFFVFLTNLVFKLIHLDTYPVWYDECFSIFYSQGGIKLAMQTSKWDICPPLYLIVMAVWTKLFGISEFSVRLLSVLFSSAAAATLFLFVKRFFNLRMAMVASIIFIASNISFFYSHEARAYSFIQFFSILTTWIFFEFMEKPDWKKALLLGACYYMLFMTHYLTVFVIIWQGLIVLCFFRKEVFKFYLLGGIAFIIFLLHWMPRLLQILTEKKGSPWLDLPDYNTFRELLYNFYNGEIWFWLFIAVSVLAIVITYRKLLLSSIQKQLLIFSVLLSIGTLLAGFYLSAYMPMFLERYLLFSLTGFILISAYLISSLPIKNVFLFGALMPICIAMLWQIDTTTPKNMDFRSAAEYVKNHKKENSLVVIQTIDVVAVFTYYYDRPLFQKHEILKDSLRKENIVSANDSAHFNRLNVSREFDNIILVQAFQNYADPNATLEKRLSEKYLIAVPTINFDNVFVTEYKKRD